MARLVTIKDPYPTRDQVLASLERLARSVGCDDLADLKAKVARARRKTLPYYAAVLVHGFEP